MLLLFGYSKYYPRGGMNDLIGRFNSEDDIDKWFEENTSYDDYHEIYDVKRDRVCSYRPPVKDDEG